MFEFLIKGWVAEYPLANQGIGGLEGLTGTPCKRHRFLSTSIFISLRTFVISPVGSKRTRSLQDLFFFPLGAQTQMEAIGRRPSPQTPGSSRICASTRSGVALSGFPGASENLGTRFNTSSRVKVLCWGGHWLPFWEFYRVLQDRALSHLFFVEGSEPS